jgi:hypothetical protein
MVVGQAQNCYEGCQVCPLVLLVKVGCRQGKALGSEEGKVMGSGLFEYAAEERI